jgi:hypothetical protein
METYKAQYQLTKDEAVKSAKQHRKTNLRKDTATTVNILALLLGVLSLFIISLEGLRSFVGLNCLLILAICLSWFLRHEIEDWVVGKIYARRTNESALIKWEFSDEDVQIDFDSLVRTTMKWKLFQEIVEGDDGFIIYTKKPHYFFWLPFSAFAIQDNIYHFKRIASSNNIEFKLKNN